MRISDWSSDVCSSDLHECLIYSYLVAPEEWPVIDESGAPGTVRVSGRLHANNGDVLRLAALAGHGIARLPSFIVGADLAAGTLVPVLEALDRKSKRLNSSH